MWGAYPDAVLPGLGVVEGGQTSTGSAVAWFRRLVSGGERKKRLRRGFGVLSFTLAWSPVPVPPLRVSLPFDGALAQAGVLVFIVLWVCRVCGCCELRL